MANDITSHTSAISRFCEQLNLERTGASVAKATKIGQDG